MAGRTGRLVRTRYERDKEFVKSKLGTREERKAARQRIRKVQADRELGRKKAKLLEKKRKSRKQQRESNLNIGGGLDSELEMSDDLSEYESSPIVMTSEEEEDDNDHDAERSQRGDHESENGNGNGSGDHSSRNGNGNGNGDDSGQLNGDNGNGGRDDNDDRQDNAGRQQEQGQDGQQGQQQGQQQQNDQMQDETNELGSGLPKERNKEKDEIDSEAERANGQQQRANGQQEHVNGQQEHVDGEQKLDQSRAESDNAELERKLAEEKELERKQSEEDMKVHTDEIKEQLKFLYYARASERSDDHEIKIQDKLDELRSIATQEYLENINGQLKAWQTVSQDIVREENERIRKERERLERLEDSGDRIRITNKLTAMSRTPIRDRESNYRETYDELITKLKNYMTEERWNEWKERYDRSEIRNK